MNIQISRELEEYMKKKGCRNISLEVAKTDHSDFDVTEIYLRPVNDKTADLLIRRGYRSHPTALGCLLLPRYRLEIDEEVRLDLKKVWIFRKITVQGIRL